MLKILFILEKILFATMFGSREFHPLIADGKFEMDECRVCDKILFEPEGSNKYHKLPAKM